MASGSKILTKTPRQSIEPTLTQEFLVERDRLVRRVVAGSATAAAWLPLEEIAKCVAELGAARAWNIALLKGARLRSDSALERSLRVVDLFCGGGGFSAGVQAAAEAAGLRTEFVACSDLDVAALEVFAQNFAPRLKLRKNCDALLDYAVRYDAQSARFAYTPEILDPALADQVGRVDLVIGGPPCQGHSNLNNHTRRADLRNSLYLTVPAVAVALKAKAIIIENVPAVLRDRSRVVDKARSVLEDAGYDVQEAVLEADKLGVAQQRKRHFLMATRQPAFRLSELQKRLHLAPMTVEDVIVDLLDVVGASSFDAPAELSSENKARVDFLFDNGKYELPNAERPDCHKSGHTYPSVYGRLYADRPAQTITGGFLSPGRGRYVHPTERRGLTPHEGARLQGFPDTFLFERKDGNKLGNKDYSKLIGDAVPPPLGYAVALACLSSF